MELHKIERQKLLSEPFSSGALKLARALSNTSKNREDELFLEVKLKVIFSLLGVKDCAESISYLETLLEELNEPIAVKNFKFSGKIYPLRFIVFCHYTIYEERIEIQLNEEYLLAEKAYMIDSFLLH